MNVSGFAMIYFMQSVQKNKSGSIAKFKKAQSEWLKFMPRKLLRSLALTPVTDRFLFGFFGVGSMPKEDQDFTVFEEKKESIG